MALIAPFRVVFFLALFAQLAGCSSTLITPSTSPAGLERLVASGRTPIEIAVQDGESFRPLDCMPPCLPTTVVGRQFALVALPIGTVFVSSPAEHLRPILIEHLAMRGFRARNFAGRGPGQSSVPSVTVTVDDLTLSAFDLLVTRRIYCSVQVTLHFRSARGSFREQHNVDHATFRRMGFQSQLSEHLDEALDKLSGEIGEAITRALGRHGASRS